jgi:hypothetical protein
MFLQTFAVLVQVSGDVFVKQVLDSPEGTLADNRQVSGLPIRTDVQNCPQPYNPLVKGSEFCSAICVNTCPELNPDEKAGAGTTIDQNNVELEFLTDALSNAYNSTADLLDTVVVAGIVDFIAPFNTIGEVVDFVWTRVETELAEYHAHEFTFTV